ncbi:DNA polymerase I [candidate division KSB1 bacterium 4484_87]|nr:MAG: DNA polymerase I [candidate division KSB1 bacterium 4484_87]
MSTKGKKLFLIDSMGLIYRGYFAISRNPLITTRGENVGAVYVFLRSILKILDEEKPDYLAAVFDTPEPTFRHKMYPEYKATREKMPDELVDQLPRIREVLAALNIPLIEVPGLEADDVMGILAREAENSGMETFLVTGDKDFMQLVSPKIKIYDPGRSGKDVTILDPEGVTKKVGLKPEQIIDYLALIGDKSDNIPGVPNIGPVTALKLLGKYDDLERIYQNLKKIEPERIRHQLEKYREQAYLSKLLVTIDTNKEIPFDVKKLSLKRADAEKAFSLMKELEFNSLLDRFSSSTEKKSEQKYEIIRSADALEKLINELAGCKKFTLDLETTDVDPMKAEIVGISFSWQEGKAFYVPVLQGESGMSGDLFQKQDFTGFIKSNVLQKLAPIFLNESIKKCGQNIKYDLIVLKNAGADVKGVDFDTMVASYLINPSLRQHNLDALALQYFNYKKVTTKSLIGSGKKQISMAEVPLDKIGFYACEDADFTQRLRVVLEPKLDQLGLKELFDKVELPLLFVLMEMEMAGVALDIRLLQQMSAELDELLDQIVKKIYSIADVEFNINSPKQLSEVLFERLKLRVIRRTKTGPSTDVGVLEELSKEHELPRYILEYRQLSKLKSTYVDALPRLINKKTGRVHTSYNQTVAATGRLSSSDPNLQNIPIRTELGRKIRKAFIPGDRNHILVDADYSQIELRIMAHLSEDENLIKAFQDGEDIHRSTAATVFNVSMDEVTEDQRRRAKEVNFGIMYGMGVYGLANRLGISNEEAENFIETYFASYPGIRKFMEESKELARKQGFVTTLLNRRRYLPEIHSENRQLREFAERNAINTPIQGSAADLIKVAMIRISERIKKENLQTKMIMQVHDELVFEVPKPELEAAKALIKEEMENAIDLKVPIKVDIGVGENWLEAH